MTEAVHRNTTSEIDEFPPLLVPQPRANAAHWNDFGWAIIRHHHLIKIGSIHSLLVGHKAPSVVLIDAKNRPIEYARNLACCRARRKEN